MITRAPIIRILLGILLLGAGASRALAHDPPPIWFEMKLEEGRLVCNLRVMAPLVDQWLKLKRDDTKALGPEERRLIAERLDRWFSEHPFLKLDDILVNPVVGEMEIVEAEYHEFKIHYLKVAMEFPVPARPRTMSFEWHDWDIFETWPIVALDALLAWDDEEIALRLEDIEPIWVWHAPAKRTIERILPPEPEPPRRISVPVLSVAFLAGLLVFLPLSFLLRLDARLRWSLVAILLLASVATAGVMTREMRPPWAAELAPLEREAAIEVFEALHRNTYNAFRFDDESAIYDTLARSVDGALLERLYDEVYESLILREEGGVVCRVTKVEILEEELTLPDDPERREFEVEATWLVRGRVGHFGHEHIRLNRYRARFLLRESEAGWCIVDVEVRDQERLEPDEMEPGR